MRTLKHFTNSLAFMLCISSMPLAAQDTERARASHIYFGVSGGLGSLTRRVNIYDNGNVEISGEGCAGCRWHSPYSYKFNLSADDLEQVKALLDIDALERASGAPCTMEAAGSGQSREHISVSLDSESRSFSFVQSCTSPELKIVRDNLAVANGILGKAADAAKADKPE